MPIPRDEALERFTDDERRELAAIVYTYPGGDRQISLDRLLLSWAQQVTKLSEDLSLPIDAHQAWGAHDVVGALLTRDRVAQLQKTTSKQLGSSIDEWLMTWDDLYRSLTVEDRKKRLIDLADRPDISGEWWWHRAPTRGLPAQELGTLSQLYP